MKITISRSSNVTFDKPNSVVENVIITFQLDQIAAQLTHSCGRNVFITEPVRVFFFMFNYI